VQADLNFLAGAPRGNADCSLCVDVRFASRAGVPLERRDAVKVLGIDQREQTTGERDAARWSDVVLAGLQVSGRLLSRYQFLPEN
jgi:hypothetical protein